MQYFIKQKVFTMTEKFDITNEQQEILYQVEGKMFSIRNKLDLLTPNGESLFHAEKKLLTIFPEYNIYTPNGEQIVKIKQKFGFRPKFQIFEGNNDITVQGNFIGHSFEVNKNGSIVATITKKYFSFGDSYVIDVLDEHNLELYLFIVIIIDQVAEAAQRSRNRN